MAKRQPRRRPNSSRWMASLAAFLVGGALIGLLVVMLFLQDASPDPGDELAGLGETTTRADRDEVEPASAVSEEAPSAPAQPLVPTRPSEPPATQPTSAPAPDPTTQPAESSSKPTKPDLRRDQPAEAPATKPAESPTEAPTTEPKETPTKPVAETPAPTEADPEDYIFGLPPHDTEHYTIYCDISDEFVADAAIRFERMHAEYSELFAEVLKPSRDKQLVFIFQEREPFVAAGGHHFMPGISLVTQSPPGPRLMVVNPTTMIDPQRDHLLRHEGWHHFKAYEIPNRLPVWLDEGMGEYLGYSIWAGDETVHGLIRGEGYHQLVQVVQSGQAMTLRQLLSLTDADWMQAVNEGRGQVGYAQAWSVVHFLMSADGGKYRPALARYITDIVRGRDTKRSSAAIVALEGAYRQWLQSLNPTTTHARYYEAMVRMLCSYLGRAHVRGQRFESAEEFLAAAQSGKLDLPPMGDEQWLPPTLMDECLWMLGQLGGGYSGQGAERIPMVWELKYVANVPRLHLTADYVDIEVIGTPRIRRGKVAGVSFRHLRDEPPSLVHGKMRRIERERK